MMRKSSSHLHKIWSSIKARLRRGERLKKQQVLRSVLHGVCFRKLEPKRVLSVSATFVGNVLQINYDADVSNQATLSTLGADFTVDTDGVLATSELTGLLADLERIDVNGNAGTFTWNGDFSTAPLSSADGNGRVVDITGLANASILATFSAPGDVRIEATNSITLGGSTSVTGDLEVSVSAGTLTDQAATTIAVTGQASFSGTTITIGDDVGDTTNFGSLRFNSTGNVNITEDSDTELVQSNTAGSLSLVSGGILSDNAATLNVVGSATLDATTGITLADAVGESTTAGGEAFLSTNSGNITVGASGTANFGSLRFDTTDTVDIEEDSGIDLSGTSAANTLTLSSTDYVRDNDGAALAITNGATFNANTSIELNEDATNGLAIGDLAYFNAGTTVVVGPDGTANFGTLRFSAVGDASIFEDSDMDLAGTSSADTLLLVSAGAIQDNLGADVTATGSVSFTAATTITLADQVTDALSVSADAFFSATGNISVGALGVANFGSVGLLTPASATIVESSATHLDGVSVNVLDLTSTDLITQSGTDTGAGTGFVVVSGSTSLTLSAGNGSILLLRSSSAPPVTVNDGSLMDNDFGGSFTVTGVDTDLRWRNISASATVGTIPVNLNDLEIDFPNADIDLAALTINLTGDLGLTSGLSVFDGGAVVTVAGNAQVIAGNQITLSDVGGEEFSVTGNAEFDGSNGITIGSAGVANFGTLQFASSGTVAIQEDSTTDLDGISSAAVLTLTSAGSIRDNNGATVSVTGAATFDAGSSIVLNEDGSNSLSVDGLAYFNAGTTIAVGSTGVANFGSLRFTAIGDATIDENSDTDLSGISSAASLTLTSAGYIRDNNGATVTITNDATFNAGSSIDLNEDGSNDLGIGGLAYFNAATTVSVGAAGTANFGSLRFTATGAVTVQEDSDTDLSGVSSADVLSVTSAGYIRDNIGATVTVTNGATFNAGTSIDLNEDASNGLDVGGLAYFNAATTIAVGSDGIANFGSLRFTATGDATIDENSSTALSGVSSAASLTLTSAGSITDNNAATVTITNAATFNAVTSIDLNEDATNSLEVGGLAYFNAGTTIAVGSAGTANFGSLRFTAVGDATIDENSDTDLSGGSSAASLSLTSAGYIADDNGATVTITNAATFNAGTSIALSDDASNTLDVGGLAYFNAAANITVGSAGTANFGSLRFTTTGDVTIQEDSNTDLSGTSSAGNLNLDSTGYIRDNNGATVTATGAGTFTAGSSIDLNEDGSNGLSIGGLAYFDAATTIAIGSAGTANFGSLRFTATGDVTIHEDSGTDLSDVSSAASLTLSSSAYIRDNNGAEITITNGATFNAGSDIELNEDVSNVLSIGDLAYFNAVTSIAIGSAGTANFGLLRFTAGGSATIQEDSDTRLTDASSSTSLTLTSSGSIEDDNTATLAITGPATFIATTFITLNEAVGNVITVDDLASFTAGTSIDIGSLGTANFGTLQFSATNAVAVQEDSDTNLVGSSNSDTLDLSSSGGIQDSVGSSLTISGAANLTAANAIAVGFDGTANFGTLTFVSGLGTSIRESSDTILTGSSSASSLNLVSLGNLTDNAATSVAIGDPARFEASGSIQLNDQAADVLSVTGSAHFLAGTFLEVGSDGAANFGTLQFEVNQQATIQEDSDTVLTASSNAQSLSLTSAGSVTDQAGASVDIDDAAVVIAGGSISLNDSATDLLVVGGFAEFEAATTINIGSLGTANFGTLRFEAAGLVSIQEDSDTDLSGASEAGTLILQSTGHIWDAANVTLDVATDASFAAVTDIRLADGLVNILDIGGHADFGASTDIAVGADGFAVFGTLQFTSGNNTSIQEDDSTVLRGDSSANSVLLLSSGSISDANTPMTIDIGDSAFLVAATTITLADDAAENLTVGGLASFDAPTSITIGAAGSALFGSISLTTDTATVQEDDDSQWQDINVEDLTFTSSGFIKNLEENSVVVGNLATLVADEFIHLGLVNIAKLNATAKAVGELDLTETAASTLLNPQFLFELNDTADQKGFSSLTDLVSFSNSNNFFLGKSSGDLLQEYSFQQNLGRSYGLFITNTAEIEIQNVLTQDALDLNDPEVERPNIYVETLAGDVEITGTVLTSSSLNENGAIVIVAADNMNINGGKLETEQVADAAAVQRVLSSLLQANAYSYDELGGTLVTTKFLFPNNFPYIPSPLASKFHTIAMSFGEINEIGFQFVVQYGDASGDWPVGVVRTFSDVGDVAGSNEIALGSNNPIGAHQESLGDVATFVRNSSLESASYYYNANYLSSHPLVNSTIVLRRSTDFFLFGNGGASDLATVVDATVTQDNSESLSGTVEPPGVPLPPEIEPFSIVELPRAEIIAVEANVTTQLVDYDEPRPLSQGQVEVAIYRVRFDDRNENGQVDEGEEPTADDILDAEQKRIERATKDAKGAVAPTQKQIREWQSEYEADGTKSAGSYAVIGSDRIRGEVVFGTFILRDDSSNPNNSDTEVELKPLNPQPEDGAALPSANSEITVGIMQGAAVGEVVHSGGGMVSGGAAVESSTKSPAEDSEASQNEDQSSDNSLPIGSTIAAGGVLWLQRYRARQNGSESAADYSRTARKWRSHLGT